jgi:hypothetical protein
MGPGGASALSATGTPQHLGAEQLINIGVSPCLIDRLHRAHHEDSQTTPPQCGSILP